MLLILLSCIPSLFFLQKFSLQRFYPFTKFIHIFGFSFCTNKSIFNSKGLLIEHQNLKNRYPYNQFGNHQIITVIHLRICKLHDRVIQKRLTTIINFSCWTSTSILSFIILAIQSKLPASPTHPPSITNMLQKHQKRTRVLQSLI